MRRRVYLVFAGNNSYTGAGLTARESLQEGMPRRARALGRGPPAAAVGALGDPHLAPRRLALAHPDPAAGGDGAPRRPARLAHDGEVQEVSGEIVDAPAHLAHDGEVREVAGEVRFRSRSGCLRVLVPASA